MPDEALHHVSRRDHSAPGALSGITVVELASYVAGPYAGALLADLGADVIKVEMPGGDPYRGWTEHGDSAMFCSLNRGKRSVEADLKSATGRELALRLVERADVLVENSRVGAMDDLGLGYEEVAASNPRLVYCSISGFGLDGPSARRPGYDTVGQAMSGLLSLLTDQDAPEPMGLSLSDHLAGVFAAYGVLAALAGRERTGRGQRVDTSLLQSSTAFLAENAARYLDEGGPPPTRRTRAASAQVYVLRASDGAPFVVHLSSPDRFWRGLVAALGRESLLEDPRFVDRRSRIAHRQELQVILDEAAASADREHWLRRLWDADVPASPLNTLAEALTDEQVAHLGIVQEVDHPVRGRQRMLGSGVNLHATPTTLGPAPMLGEHTAEILADLGLPLDHPATDPASARR